MAVSPLDNDKLYPPMAHWFSPTLLFALLQNVVLSSIFGRYADRRLMIAALDTVPVDKHMERAQSFKDKLVDETGAVWFDFVADLGDGFDSTYAMALLLARKELAFGELKLPRGKLLVMGGDEVYPKASAQAYQNQLHQPYEWAFPDHDHHADEGVPLFAIPGNHDWYDGLDLFLAFFCRQKHWHVGSWRSQQRRSYFAVQLTDDWWLWATDIQLADDMDQPQADYFSAVAENMPANSKIILCSAEPGWLYTDTNSKSWEITEYAVEIAYNAKGADGTLKKHTVPIFLSGDTHHYSRYQSENAQFITSGGGGAFLHPTHHLETAVELKCLGKTEHLKLGAIPGTAADSPAQPACYPSKGTSQSLVWRNLFFAFKNWDFSLLMGGIYWIGGVAISLRNHWDMYLIIAGLIAWGIMGYTINQEKSKGPAVLISSALHSVAQAAAIILFARHFAATNALHPIFADHWYSVWLWLSWLAVQMGIAGFLVGSTIFGLNLVVTCRWLRMNRNDAFSALRLGRYNNFLRIRIKDGKVDVFAVGLSEVPKRDDWLPNPKCSAARNNPDEPVFIPKMDLAPHLIETVSVKTN